MAQRNPKLYSVTRKATAELYRRAYESLGDAARSLRITTIDALIADLARQAANQGAAPPLRLIGEAETRLLLLESAWETFGRGRGDSRAFWADVAYQYTLWRDIWVAEESADRVL